MSWKQGGVDETEIRTLRADLERQAEIIRNCTCDRGYIIATVSRNGHLYRGAAMCECMREFKRIGAMLTKAAREYERSAGYEYQGLVTPRMVDHGHKTGARPSRETMRRAKLAVANMEAGMEIREETA